MPTHFFKVVLARTKDGSFAVAGFVLPNQPISDKKDLRDFLTPVDVIEKYAGLLFFDKVRRRSRVRCEPTNNNPPAPLWESLTLLPFSLASACVCVCVWWSPS